MSTTIARWGNSLAVRLPKSALDALDLKEGDPVQINADGGTITIMRCAARLDLEAMIASITPENLPESSDWMPVGRELL